MDVVTLSRLQFAFTIMFHYIFPPLTIGLSVVLVYLELMNWRTGEDIYARASRFWTRLYILTFGMGVATGLVMEFEFGTNWATYSRFVGDVFGSALAAEGIFAFFLESGFLAVVAFGRERVSRGFYFFSMLMVSLGSIFSSVWITVANSWQQTPAGHQIVPIMRDGQPWVVDGQVMMRAEITDFWAMVLNPSTVHRLTHVWLGAFVLGAFFVTSISAWYLLHGRHGEFARRSFKGALVLATVSSLAMLVSGHFQAGMVYRHQPAKMADFEGHFESGRGDMSLIGWPDQEQGRIRGNVAVPGGLSFLLHEDFEAEVVGLDRFRPEDRPSVTVPYFSYHTMVGLGMGFIALTLLSCWLWWRGRLFETRWALWLHVGSVVPALVANEVGWVAAETGRQPWIVHPPVAWTEAGELVTGPAGVVVYNEGLGLRTTDAVSTAIASEQVLGSIIMFGLVYLLLLIVWLTVLNHKIQVGPEEPEVGPEATGLGDFLSVGAERAGRSGSMTGAARSQEG